MERVDKSALVSQAVLAIRLGEFKDYSNTAKKFHCSYMAVIVTARTVGTVKAS
jgi:hypothetical protein